MKLEDIRKLCEAATPGPWRTYPIYGGKYAELFGPKPIEDRNDRIPLGSQADANFIAASRTLLPKLLKVVEAAKALPRSKSPRILCDDSCGCEQCYLEQTIEELEGSPST